MAFLQVTIILVLPRSPVVWLLDGPRFPLKGPKSRLARLPSATKTRRYRDGSEERHGQWEPGSQQPGALVESAGAPIPVAQQGEALRLPKRHALVDTSCPPSIQDARLLSRDPRLEFVTLVHLRNRVAATMFYIVPC